MIIIIFSVLFDVIIQGKQMCKRINNIYRRQLILSLLTMICSITYAYDFEVDGLCYNIIASDQVEVTYRNYKDDTNYSGDIQIPETVVYNNVTYRVTSIGSMAFYNCQLTSVTIPNTITTISDGAFANCYGLTGQLTIPNSITSIGESAFFDCLNLTGSLVIPNSVKTIGDGAFYHCYNLTGPLIIPNSIKSIGRQTFAFCSGLTSLSIPDGVTSIGQSAFSGCKGFTGKLIIPNSVTNIGWSAFGDCSGFTGELIIPNSVTEIMGSAFSECSGISSLTIPNTVKYILGMAFYNCSGLEQVYSKIITPYSIEETTFQGISSNAVLHIPKGTKDVYNQYTNWICHFANVIDDGQNDNLPVSTYTLSIIASGNGSASYGGETIRGATKTYTVNEGTSATITFTPDNGYRIKSLVVNNAAVTASTSYTVTVNANTTVSVEFEAIPATTYTLSIKATGNGSASYDGTAIRGMTKSFTVNEGTKATITFTPDNGYQIKSLKVNNVAVTASTSYTLTVNANTTVEVEFEAIPPTLYTLTISASGNGYASYGGTTIRGATKTFSVNEGTSATISFTPDDGYRIKSLKVNGSSKTSSTSYTVTVNADTSVEVVFEAIPPTTYKLSIKASGNGSASYDGTTIRGKTQAFTVNEGTSATITFTPDNGYRIKSLKVNGSSKTASTSYTVTVNADTSVEVVFEAIPPTTYKLSIKATGNGSASYDGTTIRGATKSFTVNEGTSATITFTPDNGYRIKSFKVNGSSKTASTSYTVTVNADTSVEVEFEEIPVTSYTLTITVIGNGYASYNGETIRNNSSTYTLNEGATGTITFTPDEGYHIKSLLVNGSAISIDTSYSFTMNSDTSVEVEFEETVVISKFSVDGLNYEVNSLEDHTVTLGAGDYGLVLEVPEKVTYNDEEWTVTGIANDALASSEELAAVIWHLGTAFNAKMTNPNLLLYVKDEAYAPVNIKNVVVNSYASSISLTEAMSGNNFYCPLAFTAQSIEYTHNYLMKSGLNESRGWETIALPFDVQKISHSSKGEIVPFAKWTSGGSAKPFWLYELSGSGFVEAEAIKANTPYIVSMPNNEAYPGEYQLTGRVTFLAENVEVKKSDEVQTATFSSNTFVPNFICRNDNEGCYALNVSNDYEYYRGAENEGSKFILNLRKLHPFEAYMTSTSGTRSIDIFDGMATGIRGIEEIIASQEAVKVYDLSGRLIKMGSSIETIRQELPTGVYIINNKKMIIK